MQYISMTHKGITVFEHVRSKTVIAIITLYPQELYEVHPYKEGLYHIYKTSYT